ncbi:hypothetical protein C8J57DRAFT_1262822 [Mycena rebaudengoi]|nr:hypothetical protein C8J57DRAFT_1262822 [Mycena rebaudengoi]
MAANRGRPPSPAQVGASCTQMRKCGQPPGVPSQCQKALVKCKETVLSAVRWGQIPKSAQGNAHIVVGLDELDGAQTRVSGQDVLVHGLAWRHYTGNLMVDQTRENHCTHRTKKSTGSFRVFGYWPEGVIRVARHRINADHVHIFHFESYKHHGCCCRRGEQMYGVIAEGDSPDGEDRKRSLYSAGEPGWVTVNDERLDVQACQVRQAGQDSRQEGRIREGLVGDRFQAELSDEETDMRRIYDRVLFLMLFLIQCGGAQVTEANPKTTQNRHEVMVLGSPDVLAIFGDETLFHLTSIPAENCQNKVKDVQKLRQLLSMLEYCYFLPGDRV